MAHWRMHNGKVPFATYQEAFAQASLQAAHFPHFLWNAYDCLWCDFAHIGRRGTAPGHSLACEEACQRRSRQDREYRIIEGVW